MDNDTYLTKILVKLILIAILVVVFRYASDRSFIETFNPNSIIFNTDTSVSDIEQDRIIVSSYLKIKIIQEQSSRVSDLDFSDLGNTKQSREKKMIGWIQIPGIVVNYPIYYSKDNNYYLKHSSKGKDSVTGAIFMDSSSDGFWHRINLIHGHNMMSGAMFGELSKYKDKAWAKKHKYIYVTEDDGMIYKFTVFSVYNMNGNTEQIKVSCASEEEYELYFKQLATRSMYELASPPANSQIIMLNTCSYSYSGEHFIVCAYCKDVPIRNEQDN